MRREDRGVAKEIIQLLLSSRKATTIRSVYGRLRPAPDGYIRSVFSPAATDTGRMASSDTFLEESTNLQNIPKKTAGLNPLYEVRDIIVPEKGRLIGEADLSQAEARVAAWMSEDPTAMWEYENDIDRYRRLAAAIKLGDPDRWAELSKKDPMRQVGKMGQLAFQYGVGWKTLRDQINSDSDLTGIVVDDRTAQAAEVAFHSLYPGYSRWWERVMEELREKGYLVNPFGRKRVFFSRAESQSEVAALRRAAVAFMPQSTIADLMNSRIAELYRLHDPQDLRVLAQVHDAVLFDCLPKDAYRVARIVKSVLESTIVINDRPLLVPAEVSLSSVSWAQTKQIL